MPEPLPSPTRGTVHPTKTATQQLAGLALSVADDPAAREPARDAVVDWYGATVAGRMMSASQIAARAPFLDEPGRARLIPDGRPASVRTAALLNGLFSHEAEMDDIYREGLYHPGSPTVAAALAVAEGLDASGAALLAAVAGGYEVGCRVAETVNPAHYRYWHTTGTVGTLGSAAAAGLLLGLDEDRLAHALAVATSMAAGLQQAFRSGSMSKPLHAGHAAEAGVVAAGLASEGYRGTPEVLDGDLGFGVAMSDGPSWAGLADAAARPPAVSQVTVKPHACCGHTFAAVDAALDLRAQGLDARRIRSVEVDTYQVAIDVAGGRSVDTAGEAKFSVGYCVGAALSLGTVGMDAFDQRHLDDPALRWFAANTALAADPQMDATFPGRRQARVVVVDDDGREWRAERATRRGDPDSPLSPEERRTKFDGMVVPVLGTEAAARLHEALSGLADLERVVQIPLGTTGVDHG
ncbi:MAG TPA: 2-methylcitrate dehydratase [Nocardioides bacterium]|nr:2-methylcitrate dehydratase [Nocardioides sp.]